MKIALIINTRNRKKEYGICLYALLHRSVTMMKEHTVKLFVIDDASRPSYCRAEYRFKSQAGIPRAKNKGLRLAYDWGAEAFFLFDDDTYPVNPYWWEPYLTSGLNAAYYTFTTGYEGVPGWRKGIVHEGGIVENALACGCMIYLRRCVPDVVGGFDPRFGLGRYCDTEFQRRIHAANLTPYPFVDISCSHLLFHSMDEAHEVKRSFDAGQRFQQEAENREYYNSVAGRKRYVKFE